MSDPEPEDFVEISQAGFDEQGRTLFMLAAVCDGQRINVWTGHSHDDAIRAARFWRDDGVEGVDLMAAELIH